MEVDENLKEGVETSMFLEGKEKLTKLKMENVQINEDLVMLRAKMEKQKELVEIARAQNEKFSENYANFKDLNKINTDNRDAALNALETGQKEQQDLLSAIALKIEGLKNEINSRKTLVHQIKEMKLNLEEKFKAKKNEMLHIQSGESTASSQVAQISSQGVATKFQSSVLRRSGTPLPSNATTAGTDAESDTEQDIVRPVYLGTILGANSHESLLGEDIIEDYVSLNYLKRKVTNWRLT